MNITEAIDFQRILTALSHEVTDGEAVYAIDAVERMADKAYKVLQAGPTSVEMAADYAMVMALTEAG
jgi:hypothetical protein